MGEKWALACLNSSRRSALVAEKVCSWGLMAPPLKGSRRTRAARPVRVRFRPEPRNRSPSSRRRAGDPAAAPRSSATAETGQPTGCNGCAADRPRPGAGQDQMHHAIGAAGREGLPLDGLDHVVGRRHHVGEIRHLGEVIMKPLKRGDQGHRNRPPVC